MLLDVCRRVNVDGETFSSSTEKFLKFITKTDEAAHTRRSKGDEAMRDDVNANGERLQATPDWSKESR